MVMFTCLLSRLCQRDKFLYLVLLLLLQLILKIKPRINALVINNYCVGIVLFSSCDSTAKK